MRLQDIQPQAWEPALAGLRDVPQNPLYHGEGDVLTHTHMVMEALAELPGYRALDAEDQAVMMTAAALHDLGKKVTTKLEDGQWTSPNHGAAGAGMARELLMTQFGLGGSAEAMREREAVCQLIRLHMKPLHILDVSNPERLLRQMASAQALAPAFSLERLAMLSTADYLGRVCVDQREGLEAISLFAGLAEEQGCARVPYVYPDAYSRFADFSGRNVAPGQRLYNDTWGTVILLSGLPGTGKDTWTRTNCPQMPMISLDDVRREMKIGPTEDQGRVVQETRERCRVLLRRHEPFVFNATNLSRLIRGKWISLFHQYHAMVRIVYLETAWETRQARNQGRAETVPEAAVAHMLREMEPPLLTEAEEVEWLCT